MDSDNPSAETTWGTAWPDRRADATITNTVCREIASLCALVFDFLQASNPAVAGFELNLFGRHSDQEQADHLAVAFQSPYANRETALACAHSFFDDQTYADGEACFYLQITTSEGHQRWLVDLHWYQANPQNWIDGVDIPFSDQEQAELTNLVQLLLDQGGYKLQAHHGERPHPYHGGDHGRYVVSLVKGSRLSHILLELDLIRENLPAPAAL